MTVGRWCAGRRAYLVLSLIVLLIRIGTAMPIERAGYMDASYTVLVSRNLALGQGFNEQVLWNYLDEPTGLPHPSNLYWMPLPALLAAGSFAIFGISYHAAQVPFVLLSVIPPLFAFYLARRVFARDDYAWLAGLLTAFSGFYTIYWIAPDNFTPYAVTTDLALLWMALAFAEERSRDAEGTLRNAGIWGTWLIAGIFAGLSELSRIDGLLLLAVAPIALLMSRCSLQRIARGTLFVLLGFLLVLLPWLARNYAVAGAILSPGGTRTLFLTSYDDLFRYNAGDLTLARFIDWGIANIVASKMKAFGFDLLVLLFGGLQIFLAPFAFIGLWQLRQRVEFKPFLVYSVLLLLAMAILFTFPGMRGSMLHSSIALVAYLAIAVPLGLDTSIHWVALRRRKWDERAARAFFRGGFVVLALGLSLFLYSQGVFGAFAAEPATIPLWNARDAEYSTIGRQLDTWGVSALQPVMTVDPPSFFNETGRRSIYLPTESTDAIFQAAQRFDAKYLVLEHDHPLPLNNLYSGRGQVEGLTQVSKLQDAIGRPVVLYEIRP